MKQILHRVLSFDGGGIRGLYQAKLLECLKAYGLDVAKPADIVAGTSTGAIVAAALALDDYEKAKTLLPPLAQGKAEEVEVRVGVKRWFDGLCTE